MHLLILLVVAAGGVLTTGLPQYQPPSSLQQYYKVPPPPAYSTGVDASRPVQGQNPMYTYAEVNTPYYQYHYYSPVHKRYHNQPHHPPLFEDSSSEPSLRNVVNSYAYGGSTTLRNLFYPAPTSIPFGFPEYGSQNNGYAHGYEPGKELFSPAFVSTKEVPITSKPLTVSNAYSPMFRTYQEPISNKVYPPAVTPVSTPTKLATGFPNILRERHGNDKNPEDPLTSQTTFKPDLLIPANANRDLDIKPIVVPESLATPSPTIIKDEIKRRGISPQLMFRDQLSAPSKKISLEKSPFNSDTLTSTSSPQFNISLQIPPRSSNTDSLSGGISETILRVFSSPNLELTQNYALNTSVALPTNTPEEESDSLDSFTQSSPLVSTQIPTDTTVSHRQKIAKKVKPTVVPKKFLFKHPNVLFYSPGHDIPN